jgi:hypothetical protein
MVAAPPRPENCDLQFLELTLEQTLPMSPAYEYEVLGHIVLGETGVQDPLQEKYRAIVRPRACSMGGEAVKRLPQAVSRGPVKF